MKKKPSRFQLLSPATAAIAKFSILSLLASHALSAAPHDLTANESIELGLDDNSNYILSIETTEDDVAGETEVIFEANSINPLSAPDIVYNMHKFWWKGFGNDLMSLNEGGALILYSNDGTGTNTVSIDPFSNKITFYDYTNGGSTVTLYQDGSALKVGDGTNPIGSVVTSNNDGSIDITNDVGNTALLTAIEANGIDALSSSAAFYSDKVMMGTPPNSKAEYNPGHAIPGLYSHDEDGIALYTHNNNMNGTATTTGYGLDEGYGAVRRLYITTGKSDQPKAEFENIRYFTVRLTHAYTPVLSMTTHDQYHTQVAINSNQSLMNEHDVLHVAGSTRVEGSSVYDAQESAYIDGAHFIAGSHNTAWGIDAIALGHNVSADSFASVVLGSGNSDPAITQHHDEWVETDELLVVGNGHDENLDGTIDASEKSNALVITKDGNATFTGEVDIARVQIKGDIPMGAFDGS